jgi:thioredoxin
MDIDNGKVVVKFWATWCGPCKSYAPNFTEAVRDFKVVKAVEIDVDQNTELAQRFGIRGIPTTLFLEDGIVVGSLVGGQTTDEVKKKAKESFGDDL